MATIIVGAPGTVEWVLGVHGLQPWRAGYLIQCGQISVKRNGAAIDLKVDGAATALFRGDELKVDDPPPAPCPGQLAKVGAAGAFRDYAMVSIALGPTDKHIPRLERFYDLRGQTIRLKPPDAALKAFIEMLARDAAVAGPIRDLMVGTHAAAAGSIAVKPTASEIAHIQFERLEKAVADRNLIVKPELLQPRPKDANQRDVPARFVIRGCAVGAALPYLRKFKEALGGAVEVVAPKFEHAIGEYANPHAHGLYEFLAYEFFLSRPKPLATDQDIVAAFIAEGLLHYDGKPIEAKTWAQWIPVGSPPRDKHEHRKYFSKVANRDVTGFAFFTTEKQDFPGEPVLVGLPFDPGTDAARIVALGVHINNDPRFKATHPWPGYVRLGYKSLSEMVDGFTWSFQYDAAREKLICRGARTTYTVHQPIVDTASGALIHNHFPIRPAGAPTEVFTDRDARFFAST